MCQLPGYPEVILRNALNQGRISVTCQNQPSTGCSYRNPPFSSMTAEVEIAAANVWMANKPPRTIATGLPQFGVHRQ
jgi:hypothetical protein